MMQIEEENVALTLVVWHYWQVIANAVMCIRIHVYIVVQACMDGVFVRVSDSFYYYFFLLFI